LLAALAMAAPAAAQTAPKPLFERNDMLRITITGPINQIARTAQQTRQARDGTLTVAGETLPVQLSPRGITRLKRDVCQFPPLWVRFRAPPGPGSIFAGQTQLKLVTHCQAAASFQQHLLLEYSAYRLYNQLTPASFRARLATVDYVDSNGRPITTRLGFFLEEIDDVAARNGMRRVIAGDRIPLGQISAPDGARVALFEYMIGNMDWSMRAGPRGDPCCHNNRPITRNPAGPFVPVPYDFDYSGLVDAPYAVPPSGEGQVTTRRYMGYCAHNPDAFAAAAALRLQRGALLAVLNEVPLDQSARRRATAYLNGFFNDIADDRTTASKVLKACFK
jgi:hypothetical protein